MPYSESKTGGDRTGNHYLHLSKIQILKVFLSIFLNHFRYTLSEGTLSNISDFAIEDLSYGQLVFKPGEVVKSLSVNIVNDTLPEVNETLILNLTSQDGITSVTEENVQIFILDNGEYSQVRKILWIAMQLIAPREIFEDGLGVCWILKWGFRTQAVFRILCQWQNIPVSKAQTSGFDRQIVPGSLNSDYHTVGKSS